MRFILLTAILALLVPAAAAAERIGGYTNMSHSSGHGTQIEYLTTDGRAYLWYPGNAVILAGRWKTGGDEICFAYGKGTYNPVTGTRGGGFECMPYRLWWWSVEQRMKGDIFALKGRDRVPFRLDRARTTLEKVLARTAPRQKAPELEVPVLRPKAEVAPSCSSIVANAERSKADMSMAASVYFHGRFMGKPCVKVDYRRAFALARASGTNVEPWLRTLRKLAATGNPRAIAALKAVGP